MAAPRQRRAEDGRWTMHQPCIGRAGESRTMAFGLGRRPACSRLSPYDVAKRDAQDTMDDIFPALMCRVTPGSVGGVDPSFDKQPDLPKHGSELV